MVLVDRWWEEDVKHDQITALVEHLKSRQRVLMEADRRNAAMYSNKNMLGILPYNYNRSNPQSDEERLRMNQVEVAIDTIQSKLAVNQPRVVMLPSNANFNIRSKAKKLQKFIDGILVSSRAYINGLKVFRDAEITGTGVIRVTDEWGNIITEPIPRHEILIDEEEAYYGQPTQLHHIRIIPRDKLKAMFSKNRKAVKAIDDLPRAKSDVYLGGISDMVEVRESWHLASGPDVADGRHCWTIQGYDLVDEPYKHRMFPFVFVKWKEPQFGFWGQSLVDSLRPMQIELNRLLISAQESMSSAGNTMIFLQMGSHISKQHLSNKNAIMVPYVGAPPIIRASQTVHDEAWRQIDRLSTRILETAGVSQLSATGAKPPVDSQVALVELQQIESERFSVVQRAYEQMFVDMAKVMISLARDIYAENEADTEVVVKGRSFLDTVKWSDIDLEETAFDLQLDVASRLPLTRAGRIQTATNWYQAQLISAKRWRELVNLADVDEENELQDAPRDYVREVIYQILFEGKQLYPEKRDDLEFAYDWGLKSYQEAKLQNFPGDSIERLGIYISAVEKLLSDAEAPAAPAPTAPPPAPIPTQQLPSPVG